VANIRLWDYLPQHRDRRRKRGQGRMGRSRILCRVGIEERPPGANDRVGLGHLECDLVCFSTGGGAICHLVERESRYGIALKLADKSADGTRLELMRRLRRVPRGMTRSLAFDIGLEFSQHYILREALGISTYAPQAHKFLPPLLILGEGRGGASELPSQALPAPEYRP